MSFFIENIFIKKHKKYQVAYLEWLSDQKIIQLEEKHETEALFMEGRAKDVAAIL